jgi:hypothetical protein
VSDSSGRELIRRKVKLLSVMAGNFREPRFESNLLVDVPAAQKVFADWPTPVVASGFEIGVSLPYPRASIAHDYGYVAHHPIADTYLTFCEELKPLAKWTCPHEHSTFDLTSVLYAARPDRGYFSLSKPGRITVLPDGSSRFEEAEGGRDRYLILKEEEKARAIEAMAMLASQPPK